jgi:sugar lactone lactonase YvrE
VTIVTPVSETEDILGESPIWDRVRGCLWWIDITGGVLHRLNAASGVRHDIALQQRCGSIGLRQTGGLVAATWSGFAGLDPDTGAITPLADVLGTRDGIRFNDGRVGPDGRFWAGTVQNQVGGAAFYRFDRNHQVAEIVPQLTCSNGLTWSPDGKTMYLADSGAGLILAFDFDYGPGCVSRRRVFLEYPREYGVPDGATVDTEGNLWSAGFGGWHVLKITPEGRIADAIRMPVLYPTSCAFGGPDLRTMYVTSARKQLQGDALAAQPRAGQLFVLAVDAQGLPDPAYLG